MSIPPLSNSSEPIPAAAAFSYAQAAKGKSAPPTASASGTVTKAQPQEAKESGEMTVSVSGDKNSWAEDAATVVEEHDGSSNGNSSKNDTTATSHKSSEAQTLDTNAEDSSVSTAHEDALQGSQAPQDGNWDHKSTSSISNEASSGTAVEGSRKNGNKDRKSEKTAAEAMKEAPPPPVNIWAQRAQDAKAKQHPTPAKPAMSQPSHQASSSAGQLSTAIQSSASPSIDVSAGRAQGSKSQSASRHSESRAATSSRSEKQARNVQPPTVNDASAWPTPLNAQSAQEAEKKRASEKVDKVETERPPTKSHGRSEWVSVPFTPSVKFETPLPGQGRRGGRPGGRGGRGGTPFSERSNRSASASDAHDGQERNREDDTNSSRTSSLPGKSKRASTDAQEQSDAVNADAKHPSRTESSSQRQSTASEPRAKQPNGTAARSDVLQAPSRDAKPSSDTNSVSEVQPKKFENGQADAGSNGEPTAKPLQQRPRNSRATDASITASAENDDRRKDEASSANARSGPSARKGDVSRQTEAGREGSPPQRGGRGGRRGGRGGRGDYNPHTTANGHATAIGVTAHTSKGNANFASQYAHQYAPFLGNGRGGYRNNGPRSASIPSGYVPGFGFPSPFELDINGMYGMGVNGPAQQFPPHNMELMMLQNGVATQLTYYFSLDNLLKDMYLRSHMDSKGFVSLGLIASFKRMASLTGDVAIIRNVSLQIPSLEVRTGHDGMDRVRVREGWDKWVLPMEDRQESARHDGPPSEMSHPSRSAISPGHGPFSPDGYYQAHFSNMHGGYPLANPASSLNGFTNGNKAGNRHSVAGVGSEYYTSAQYFPQNDIGTGPSDEADSFPDASIGQLTVVVRPENEGTIPKPLDASSRTFSDRSLEGEAVVGDADKSQISDSQAERDEKIEELRRTLTKQSSGSKQKAEVELYWIKEKETPESMPAGTATEPYLHLHEKALHQRKSASKGETPHDMDVLYQFWSHFLIRNYNASMYNEFRTMAHEDASINGTTIGMQNLIKYYGASLSSAHAIRTTVLSHYIDLVKNEDPGRDRAAYKQLRNAWRDGSLNMRNRKRLHDALDAGLRAELER